MYETCRQQQPISAQLVFISYNVTGWLLGVTDSYNRGGSDSVYSPVYCAPLYSPRRLRVPPAATRPACLSHRPLPPLSSVVCQGNAAQHHEGEQKRLVTWAAHRGARLCPHSSWRAQRRRPCPHSPLPKAGCAACSGPRLWRAARRTALKALRLNWAGSAKRCNPLSESSDSSIVIARPSTPHHVTRPADSPPPLLVVTGGDYNSQHARHLPGLVA